METNKFAGTGVPVSRLGFGAMGFAGWFGERDRAAHIRSVHYALHRGITFFDTARAYGDSEEILGDALNSWSGSEPFVASKPRGLGGEPQWGRPVPVETSYPRGHITSECEQSLRALKRESIDLFQLHTWWPSWGIDGYWRSELEALRSAGKIRAYGVSIPDHRSDIAIELARGKAVDSIQTVVNIFDPLALDSLAPICEANGVALIARCILDEGGLTGFLKLDTEFGAGDFREGYFDTVIPRSLYIEKVDALRRYVPEHAGSLAELAIRYALQNSGVTTAITSMHVEQFVRMNVEAAERGPLPGWLFEELFTMHRFALHLSYFKNFGTPPG